MAFVGSTFSEREFINKSTGDTFTFSSMSIESGIGWYDYDFDLDDFLFNSWYSTGFGLGIEYRIPFQNKKTIEEISGQKYNPLYLNARAEFGAGFSVLYFPFSIHLQLGYASNFREHFVRPGIGISLLNLQLGTETLIKKNTLDFNGFYARYLIPLDY